MNHGYLMLCKNFTVDACLNEGIFGGPNNTISDMIKYITPGETIIFLLNLSKNAMFGPFLAKSKPQMNLKPDIFHGAYTAQVKVESKEHTKWYYNGKNKKQGKLAETD